MSAPPPYPGEKGGPPPQQAYPQQQGGYPQQYPPQGQPAPAGYPPQGQPGYPQGQPGYPQGQPGYPQGQQYPGQAPPQTTVVVTQPVVPIIQSFRETPVHTRCPHCQAEVVTGTTYETGTFAWIICAVLCIFGCDLGCCLIPFCVDGCKDVVHSCPNCRQVVARWNRL